MKFVANRRIHGTTARVAVIAACMVAIGCAGTGRAVPADAPAVPAVGFEPAAAGAPQQDPDDAIRDPRSRPRSGVRHHERPPRRRSA